MTEQDAAAISKKIKDYLLREFLPDEDPDELTPTTGLISTSIIDSVSSLQLVAFLEEEFDISIEAHEADVENLDTLELLTALVVRKRQAAA